MLARRIPKTLPAQTFEEVLERAKTHSSVAFALLTIRFPMPDGSEAVLILARVKSL